MKCVIEIFDVEFTDLQHEMEVDLDAIPRIDDGIELPEAIGDHGVLVHADWVATEAIVKHVVWWLPETHGDRDGSVTTSPPFVRVECQVDWIKRMTYEHRVRTNRSNR